jgi:hypothetical protein
MLLELNSLSSLSISGLSVEGIRELQKFIKHTTRLVHLTIDSQFIDDPLLLQVADLKFLEKLLIKTSGTKVNKICKVRKILGLEPHMSPSMPLILR